MEYLQYVMALDTPRNETLVYFLGVILVSSEGSRGLSYHPERKSVNPKY